MRSDILNVNSSNFGDGADVGNDIAMPLVYKEKIVLLTDHGAA